MTLTFEVGPRTLQLLNETKQLIHTLTQQTMKLSEAFAQLAEADQELKNDLTAITGRLGDLSKQIDQLKNTDLTDEQAALVASIKSTSDDLGPIVPAAPATGDSVPPTEPAPSPVEDSNQAPA